ncbi:MAG: efflux RND transporter periplasmic adaptor subunit, partial [Nitrospirota bacterium]
MTSDPHEPIQHIPVSEIIPSPAASPPSDPSRQHDHAIPITVIPLPHPRTTSRLPWLIGSIAGIALIGAGLWYWIYGGTPPIQYKTGLVDRGPITAIVTATGTVNPVVSVQVGSQVSGKIAKLFVDFNSAVTQGQPLAQIDQLPFQSRVSQARAAVKSAAGTLAKANNMAAQRKRERDRMAALRTQAFVSQADLDLAETNSRDAAAQIEVAQAQVDQAQATLASAELDLGYTTMYSPVNGIVVSRA